MSNIGYVAIDDLELEAFEGDCSYEPPSAKPTTTPATTTTPQTTTPQPNKGSCNFQEDTCGWEVSAKNAEFFGWNRTNGILLSELNMQPSTDRSDSDSGILLSIYNSMLPSKIQITNIFLLKKPTKFRIFLCRLLYVCQPNICGF